MKYLGSKGKYFAERLLQAREEVGLSRTDLAKALTEAGFKKSYDDILKYEKGIRKPNYEVVESIAELLGVNIEWLLDDNRETFKDPGMKYPNDTDNPVGAEWLKDVNKNMDIFEDYLFEYVKENFKSMPYKTKLKIGEIIEAQLQSNDFDVMPWQENAYREEYMKIFRVKKKDLPKDINEIVRKINSFKSKKR